MKHPNDSVITYIVETLSVDKPDHLDLFADIEGYKINGLTIPSNIVITQQRPDIVLIDKSATPHTVWLFELSVSFERNYNVTTRLADLVGLCWLK